MLATPASSTLHVIGGVGLPPSVNCCVWPASSVTVPGLTVMVGMACTVRLPLVGLAGSVSLNVAPENARPVPPEVVVDVARVT